MDERTDRITRLDGTLIAGELSPDVARAKHRALTEQHVPHFWQRWGGERSGWNTVAGLFQSADADYPVFAQ